MRKKYRNYFFLGIGVVVILILGGFLFWQSRSSLSEPSETNINLSDKSSTFKISGDGIRPIFKRISLDPFETKGGEQQKLVVFFDNKESITSVYAEVEDEIGKRKIDFVLGKNKNDESYWLGQWQIKVTKEKEYPIIFFAENDKGEKNRITLLWQAKEGGELKEQALIDKAKYGLGKIKAKLKSNRVLANFMNDVVSISKDNFPHSGNTSLDAIIALSSSDSIYTGIDGGSLTINNGKTLQLNSNVIFVFNQGQSISPVGSIAIADGAEIRKGYLWMKDADGDGCAVCDNPNDVVYTSSNTSPGAGWVRVKDIEYHPDPDDGSPGDAPSCVPACECTDASDPCCDGCHWEAEGTSCGNCGSCSAEGVCTGQGVCAPGTTNNCTKTCNYNYCNSSDKCKTTSSTVNGAQTCQSDCQWGTCSGSCPSSECNDDSGCKPVTCDWEVWAYGYDCIEFYPWNGGYCALGCIASMSTSCRKIEDEGNSGYTTGWSGIRRRLSNCTTKCWDADNNLVYTNPDKKCAAVYYEYECVCQ